MIDYRLIRNRRKTIAIIVHRDGRGVEVRAPLSASEKDIEAFVNSKAVWIAKALADVKPMEELGFGSEIMILGKLYTIAAHDEEKIFIDGTEFYLPGRYNSEQIVFALNAALKDYAFRYIPGRVAFLAEKTGISYSSVKINCARTHWGSCTSDRLNFSCYLMLADEEIIDYVIIHELSHILHHDHSPQFWKEVEKHCPDYKTFRERLKAIGAHAGKLHKK